MEEIIQNQIKIFKQVLAEIYLEAKDPEFESVNMKTVYQIYHEVNNDLRVKQRKEEKEKPSSKQINYANDLGIKDPEKYTREDLSKVIDEKLKNK